MSCDCRQNRRPYAPKQSKTSHLNKKCDELPLSVVTKPKNCCISDEAEKLLHHEKSEKQDAEEASTQTQTSLFQSVICKYMTLMVWTMCFCCPENQLSNMFSRGKIDDSDALV